MLLAQRRALAIARCVDAARMAAFVVADLQLLGTGEYLFARL